MSGQDKARPVFPKVVVLLGLTSLFNDVATEMTLPLLPVFLAELGSGTTLIGIIEGIADATSSFLKLGSGFVADRWSRSKPLVVAGYAAAAAVRPLVALATVPWHVLAVRVGDRVGKGVRTAPRDTLLAAAAPPGQLGRVFGFHEAMDHAGALIGPLLAAALLWLGLSLRPLFALAAIPGAVAVGCVVLVREGRRATPGVRDAAPRPTAAPERRSPLAVYLGILLVFSLGNSSDALLLLRARELGVSVAALPLLWASLSGASMLFAYAGGVWSDRTPRVRLIVAGWCVYAFTYLGLAWADAAFETWLAFAAYGAYHGLAEPAQKALIKDLAPAGTEGRAYGAYHFVVGAAALPAGALTGYLWEHHGPRAALSLGGGLAALAALFLLIWQRRRDHQMPTVATC